MEIVRATRVTAVILSAAILTLGWIGAGCGGSRPAALAQSLPAYRGTDVALFDDAIDGDAVGLGQPAGSPVDDATLRNRTRRAEVVSRLRVSTVTVDTVGGQARYHVQLSMIGKPIVQRGLADGSFDVAIRPDSAAFGIVKWYDTRLIGQTFIGFLRRFGGSEEAEIRFHLSADTAAVAAAVEQAKALGELEGP